MITCAIANDGILMKPYLIDRVENENGSVMKQFTSGAYGKLITEQEAENLTQLMAEVVESGTATKLKGLGYTAAGKTGSAECKNRFSCLVHRFCAGGKSADLRDGHH